VAFHHTTNLSGKYTRKIEKEGKDIFLPLFYL